MTVFSPTNSPGAAPPRIIVHVGMHKTGTSSIQDTFYNSTDPNIAYIDWERSNHSTLFVLLFQDEDKFETYRAFKNAGPDFIDRLPELRTLWTSRVARQVTAAKDKTVIFSAEDISGNFYETAAQRMYDFFSGLSPDVGAIGYARNPHSFVQSAFQEHLRGGLVADLERKLMCPNYRIRFEKIDRLFGPENVILKEFHPERLVEGNVVKDFAATIGVAAPSDDKIIRSNNGLSLEATALLYVQRKFGQGYVAGFPKADVANNRFVSNLATIGSRRFALADGMLAPFWGRIADDVAWIEARMGHTFAARQSSDADPISTTDDLIDIALSSYDDILVLNPSMDRQPRSLDSLVACLERIREATYREQAIASA